MLKKNLLLLCLLGVPSFAHCKVDLSEVSRTAIELANEEDDKRTREIVMACTFWIPGVNLATMIYSFCTKGRVIQARHNYRRAVVQSLYKLSAEKSNA